MDDREFFRIMETQMLVQLPPVSSNIPCIFVSPDLLSHPNNPGFVFFLRDTIERQEIERAFIGQLGVPRV